MEIHCQRRDFVFQIRLSEVTGNAGPNYEVEVVLFLERSRWHETLSNDMFSRPCGLVEHNAAIGTRIIRK